MTEEGQRVTLEDNDDGKGPESAGTTAEGTDQGDSSKGEEGKKSGWGRGTFFVWLPFAPLIPFLL